MEISRIYMNKVFMRLKNKTQLFSAQADDHYHTRLIHSLEVSSIATNIGNKIKDKYNIDLNAIQKGALLHDIGHTPFGHAGERTLHKILSGKDSCYNYVNDIKKYHLEQGFKHNINSGLLYKESTPYFKINYKVMDAIIKHTKIYYTKEDYDSKLDYGFNYVINGISELSNEYFNHNPKFLEGYIVSIADEIAQICSDYLDLVNFGGDFLSKIKKTKLYQSIDNISNMNYRKQAEAFCTYLSDIFIEELLLNNSNNFILKDKSKFLSLLNDFNNIKKKCIDKNIGIKLFDNSKATIIKTLFAFYYIYPSEIEKGIFDSICNNLKDINGLSKEQYIEINCIFNSDNKKDKIIEFILKTKENLIKNTNSLSNNEIQRCKMILKTFIRYIAVFISKMTDNFASEKYKKIVSSKYFIKNS